MNDFEPTEQEVINRATAIAHLLRQEGGFVDDPSATDKKLEKKQGVKMMLCIITRIARLELMVEKLRKFWIS